ncbi:MAG: bifunctional UDP-3-O-[3-hydroxymyristoyl] N-acetylglucosamine deacetylase/3-hydroxyacyl-ACP dehydratase [Gemmatimonadota bacterium]|nr:MAG: bifunctional UDP-3-O-[3-hydroxymyristoyl] N-acetylglucosamine deacetylase/3-hydroxyacyl-ACP dehydratase [Gemmatimonadota bacterium]
MKQQTLTSAIELEGKGLHTGESVRMVIRPAPDDSGIVFRRVDLDGCPEISASVDNVVNMERGTVLERDGARVRTTEHLLSALAGVGIDNAVVDLTGEEPPAADGSAASFVELLPDSVIERQESEAPVWTCEEPFVVEEGSARYAVVPDSTLRISASIEFEHPLISRQHASYVIDPGIYREAVARARTFGFLHEAEQLRASGLARGADLGNTVVLTPDGLYAGVELRFADEFVRHKILDIIGDLALTGVRIHAQIVAERPGHRGNVALAREITERTRRQRSARRVDIEQIFQILPHRYPFLLVDRVIEYERAKRIVGIKNVTINEPFFIGHFPGLPIMPGVLIIEAMAQVGGLLLMDSVENPEEKIVYFMSLDNVKFRRPVTPGDQLVFELEMLQMRRSVCRMKGVGRVDGTVVAEAEMMAQVVDR